MKRSEHFKTPKTRQSIIELGIAFKLIPARDIKNNHKQKVLRTNTYTK